MEIVMLKYAPAVFAVGKSYQIMVPVTVNSLFRIKVGDRYFYDEQNGIMCSLRLVHRVTVPAELLDKEKKYTVCERELIDRKPYFPESREEVETEFEFSPLPEDGIRMYHIADTHNLVQEPVRAAEIYGDIDLLIMNGDIPDDSGDVSNFDSVYQIADMITHGRIPIVFARGNHDMRGYHAEEIADYTPNQSGNTYYSVRVGSLWFLVLDSGEDKDDSSPEYGHTVACRQFRERQIDFIKEIIENSEREYAAEGVKHRLLLCHNPFTHQIAPKYSIDEDVFIKWAQLIRESIKPELMICGHLHELAIGEVGGKYDRLGQPCPLVIGSDRSKNADPVKMHAGAGIELSDECATVVFTDSNGALGEPIKIALINS